MRQYLVQLLFLLALQSQVVHGFELPWLSKQNIQGNFTQEKHLAALSRPFVTKGEYQYTVETGLQWHTREPVNNYLIINQYGVAEKQPDGNLKTLTTDSSFSALLLPIFSGDPQKLKQHFNISENARGLILEPLAPKIANVIKSLNLVITNQTLQQITLNETNGNLTHIFLEAKSVSSNEVP